MLIHLVKSAAENVRAFDATCQRSRETSMRKVMMLLTISYFTLEELASVDGESRLRKRMLELELQQTKAV